MPIQKRHPLNQKFLQQLYEFHSRRSGKTIYFERAMNDLCVHRRQECRSLEEIKYTLKIKYKYKPGKLNINFNRQNK